MLHNDTAQQRAGEQLPASAPKTSQKIPRAQRAAKSKIPTLRPVDRRDESRVVTGLRAGDMDAKPIHIYDRHSPPPRPTTHNLTTHAVPRPLLQDGLMTGLELAHMNQQRQARYHPFGDGHVQAHSVFGPELGTWQQLQPEAQQQLSHFSTPNLHHSTTAPPHPTRHTPSGEG